MALLDNQNQYYKAGKGWQVAPDFDRSQIGYGKKSPEDKVGLKETKYGVIRL